MNVNPDNPIIGVRSFGDDPQFVAKMGRAFIQGLQDHGMIACAKHFPGHGNTAVDSHIDMPVIDVSREEFERVDLLPFRVAIEAGAMGIMTAHINVPAFNPDSGYPATLSHAVTTGLLREKMGFQGLIISDSLKMDAITRYFPPGEAELQSVLAGTDILLVPFFEQAFERLIDAVRNGTLPEQRLDESVLRILTAKSWCDLHEKRFVDVDELHHRIGTEQCIMNTARKITRSSITLVKNERNMLPLNADTSPRILSILYYDHPLGDIGETFQEEMRKRARGSRREFYEEGVPDETGNIRTVTIGYDSDPRFEEDTLQKAADSDLVVCALMYRIIMRRGTPNLRLRAEAFLRCLTALDVPVAVVSFCSPYLLKQAPDADAFVAAYMYSPLVQKAAVEALFGEIPFEGKLPVKLPRIDTDKKINHGDTETRRNATDYTDYTKNDRRVP